MDSITQPLQNAFFAVLEFFYNNVTHNWGWAIVLLTVVVRLILFPLTWKQIKSMRALQALQPKMKEIQEKYRENKEILNQKMMEFYQQNKVNPFGSCLPLILQIPVFIGVFYMLRDQEKTVFLGSSWLWVGDITKFDWFLLIFYVASQFLASLQTSGTATTQQRMLVYVMPVAMGIIMLIGKWPAGLFIYWCTSNVWTIAQQYVMLKVLPAPVPAGGVPAKGKKVALEASGAAKSAGPPVVPEKSGGPSGGEKAAAKKRKDKRKS